MKLSMSVFYPYKNALRVSLSALTLTLLGACAGASFETDVAGRDFVPRSAIHFETDNNQRLIMISDRDNLCDRLLEDDAEIENHKVLRIDLSDREIAGFDIQFKPLSVGDYDIRQDFGDFEGRGSGANFVELDDDCELDLAEVADEGEILIDRFEEEGTISGSIDIEFDSVDTVGTFTARFCEIDADDANRDDDECDP